MAASIPLTTHADATAYSDAPARAFERVATIANYRNNADAQDETVSEIVSATKDGNTLVYTDGALEQIGFVDITDPANPLPAGTMPVGGEPTSVSMLDNRLALVGINTSDSFTNPSGNLLVVDIIARGVVASFDLHGQPDSVAVSPLGNYAAIAMENERDEDITVDGVEGGLPQLPAGELFVIEINDPDPLNWGTGRVALTGLSDYAPEDPEPEFVDINNWNQAVVTLQENNHIVVVNLKKGAVVADFPAGSVDLVGVDDEDDGDISLTATLTDVPREPDAVAWVRKFPGFGYAIATANEGDLFGGSRGFSLFDYAGNVLYDSGTDFEQLAVRHGHYPEGRSDNKGSEPESIEFGRFWPDSFLFVGSERGSFVAVYQLNGTTPAFHQLLPAPLGPEGLLAIPERGLLVVSGEEDDPEFGVRSTMMIYALRSGAPSYPQIISADMGGSPIPWSALSGMVGVPGSTDQVLAVWDSFYATSKIFRIDVSGKPAVITDAFDINGGTGNYDPEGIAVAPDGTLWIASEGNASDSRTNRLLQTDAAGNVLQEINLPQQILDCRAASTSRGTLGSGFEGVATMARLGGGYRLIVAQQRGWDYTTPECEALDDDAGGLNANGEPNWTRLWIYDPADGSWDHAAYELAPLPANASWVGLSEISQFRNGGYMLIERDNRTGDFAELKTLVRLRLQDINDGAFTAGEKRVYDLLPAMKAGNGWISDKPEGVAVTADKRVFLVTDNDGVDDWSGETSFLELGTPGQLFFGR
jgi:hypothetical protein